MFRRVAHVVMAAALALAPGCAVRRLAWDPGELRAEVVRRAPTLRGREVVVPFEIDAEVAARARAAVADAGSESAMVRRLVAAMFDPEEFGVSYVPGITGTAADTLRSREGSCLALASVFVGLARAVGLRAYYMDASSRVHETRIGSDGLAVNEGHVTAMVETSSGRIGLDFERLGPIRWYRILDDVEALAHFHNNRGYELVERSRERGEPADWGEAAREFRAATEVAPGFARAWNNLGIASAHLGRPGEAIASWREAIRRDPALPAPRNNLGAMLLETGHESEALETLEEAVQLDDSGPVVRYNLALARLRAGDRAGAVRALRSAVRDGAYPRAQQLLDELTVAAAPRTPGGERVETAPAPPRAGPPRPPAP